MYDKEHVDKCLPYARAYAKMNEPDIERVSMFAAFAVHDAIYGHNVSCDRAMPSGKSYHEWLKGIITEAVRKEW